MEESCRDLMHQLSYYTLTLRDPEFIHQLVVDAYAAEHGDEKARPMKLTFALVGLYLVNERGYTGKQVQETHMALAKRSRTWPSFPLPAGRDWLTVQDVVRAPDAEKQAMIRKWSASVWEVWRPQEAVISGLLAQYLDFR